MLSNKATLVGAALAGLLMTAGCQTGSKSMSAADSAAKGECHGVNSCKGSGDCGGKGYSCAGKNSCKGKGWNKMTKKACADKGGKFKG